MINPDYPFSGIHAEYLPEGITDNCIENHLMSYNDTQKILKISDELKNKKLIIADKDFIKDKVIINGISRMDLMGGRKSLFNGFVNVDKIAEEGIKTQIEYLDKVVKNNSCKEIMVNNPYGVNGITILEVTNHLLIQNGRIMISGTLNNKYFNKLMKEKYQDKMRDLGFEVNISNELDEKLKNQGFYQTNGKTRIPTDKMKTIYLKKITLQTSTQEVKNGKLS